MHTLYNVGIKEKDRLIKKLMEKLETKEAEMKETKTTHAEYFSKGSLKYSRTNHIVTCVFYYIAMSHKDSQIAQLIKRIMLLEEKLKKQIEEAKEKLEEEQRICREKIEDAKKTCAQRNKETQRDMEEQLQEQLQLVRQENSQTVGLKEAVSALANELSTIKLGLMNVTNVVTDIKDDVTDMKDDVTNVKDDVTDMKSGMKQTAQEIKETQRQMSNKMNETTEELSKKIEEQGTAFRDEVQSTKDEMAAKMDKQAEEMTKKIKTDVQEAIIATIVAPPGPVQETTYTAFEEDQNPHDQEASHCVLSSQFNLNDIHVHVHAFLVWN